MVNMVGDGIRATKMNIILVDYFGLIMQRQVLPAKMAEHKICNVRSFRDLNLSVHSRKHSPDRDSFYRLPK